MENNSEFLKPTLIKLERARKQLLEIYDFNKNLWKENKIQITPKLCVDKKGYEFYTNNYTEDNLLEEISLRIGEYIHNLRSTLDNLIFGFARIKTNPPTKPIKLSFPIFENENYFVKDTKEIFNQIPEILKNEIIKYQPYNVRKNNPKSENSLYSLSIVQTLNNIDKHRVPIILVANLNEIKFDGSFEFDNEDFTNIIDEKNGFCNFYKVLPNSKIFEFRTLEKIEKMNMNFDVSVDIAIDYPNQNLNIDILKNLYNDIALLINDLILVVKKTEEK
ncbi:hypothetical protein [Flavobacterium terrigena]|uniref:Uncharacterized protein n=1 Tax=Flavobacterium terrigena TaxID=402734 RepID=A0A1H6QFG4_9FLAO|nr:hypothetical protein [Flavobacterium terrigena]SEI37955.1 hypothetical protein SAMN05660918_0214 [Flavobacterium terrigena]